MANRILFQVQFVDLFRWNQMANQLLRILCENIVRQFYSIRFEKEMRSVFNFKYPNNVFCARTPNHNQCLTFGICLKYLTLQCGC